MTQKPGPEKGEAYGIAALTQALSGIDFPASKEEIIEQDGNKQFQPEKGQTMTVRDALQNCSMSQFNTMADVVACPEVQDSIEAA